MSLTLRMTWAAVAWALALGGGVPGPSPAGRAPAADLPANTDAEFHANPNHARPHSRDNGPIHGLGTQTALDEDATIAQNEQTKVIESFLTNPAGDEIEIDVKNVTFAELNTPPYKASVDFDKRYVAPGTRQERKRETYVAHIDFTLRETVPNAFVRVNPLGLQITYFRVDQAFQ